MIKQSNKSASTNYYPPKYDKLHPFIIHQNLKELKFGNFTKLQRQNNPINQQPLTTNTITAE